MKTAGPCGWCLDGLCCQGRTFSSFVCTHARRCDTKLYKITWPGSGWCSVHSKDHGAYRCPDINEPGVQMTNLVQQAWNQLDEEVDEITALGLALGAAQSADEHESIGRQLDLAKARARGKAEILALFMTPHFRTADEISVEAARRKHYRDLGEPYETAGLGARRAEPPQ